MKMRGIKIPGALRVDTKFLLWGYAATGGLLALGIGILTLLGPPAPPPPPSVTVPIETIVSDNGAASQSAQAGGATTALPAPPTPPNIPSPLPAQAAGLTGPAAARPFDKGDKRPRIAILVGELGLGHASADAAIDRLPPEVSLAILPFSEDAAALAIRARKAGHEVLVDVPMEPSTYPDDDPGPDALMTNVSDGENLSRFDRDLTRVGGYVGAVNYMGSRFTAEAEKLKPIFGRLRDRQLILVDTRTNPLSIMPALARQLKVPFAQADILIDSSPSREAIDRNLAALEATARAKGSALGVAATYPVTFERLAEWLKSLNAKGIALAPVSAVTNLPKQ